MHEYSETRLLPYTAHQLYSLVLDIESYPQFLPWCRAARILSRTSESLEAELIISFHHLSERYVSRVLAIPPSSTIPGSINVSQVRGPFKTLENHWRFTPQAKGCEIALDLSFQFKSALLDRLMGGMFERACEKMVGAFTARADALYGS